MREKLGILRSLAIYYGNPYLTRRLRRLYADLLKEGDLYFDIGAHVGNRISAALRAGARVVALEPNPSIMRLLQRRYGENKDVTLLEEAIGRRAGTATLFVSERTPTVSTTKDSWIGQVSEDQTFEQVVWDRTITVPMTSLDTLVGKYGLPVFCKLDVEGSELDALYGLSSAVPFISFEYLPTLVETAAACINRLEELAHYDYNWSTAEQHKFGSRKWLSAREIIDLLQNDLSRSGSGDIYARCRD